MGWGGGRDWEESRPGPSSAPGFPLPRLLLPGLHPPLSCSLTPTSPFQHRRQEFRVGTVVSAGDRNTHICTSSICIHACHVHTRGGPGLCLLESSLQWGLEEAEASSGPWWLCCGVGWGQGLGSARGSVSLGWASLLVARWLGQFQVSVPVWPRPPRLCSSHLVQAGLCSHLDARHPGKRSTWHLQHVGGRWASPSQGGRMEGAAGGNQGVGLWSPGGKCYHRDGGRGGGSRWRPRRKPGMSETPS